VLDGYAPVRALHSPPDWLKPLDPGAEAVITLDGGFEIRCRGGRAEQIFSETLD
jgi:hypothetical protein